PEVTKCAAKRSIFSTSGYDYDNHIMKGDFSEPRRYKMFCTLQKTLNRYQDARKAMLVFI
ncbi:MAG TPA: hypothetical protein PLM27_00605, partial [Chitinophagales bacterium]|nr:hypothetical protein [Chitinophagales bacterium]